MKTVLVIFGGKSPEHDVSIVSALAAVVKPLKAAKQYNLETIYISKDGNWYWGDAFADIAVYRSGKIDSLLTKSNAVSLEFTDGLTLTKKTSLGRVIKQKIDIVFPVMHGSYGEDGSLMGLLEMAGVPYVGCDVPSSALAMDKVLAKQVATAAGIPTSKWTWFAAAAFKSNPDMVYEATASLEYPLFVKPAHAGSSIGITRVNSRNELMNAVEVAAHYDSKVLIEEAVQNLIEVTLPMMGNDEPIPALLERPLTSGDDFFDFESKYMNGGKGKGKNAAKTGGKKGAHGYSELPAKLNKELYEAAEQTGLAVFRALGCVGFARVDMLIDSKAQKVYFNEVNPMPGSLYAHNWRQTGVSGVELVNRLLELAVEAHQQKERIQTSFSTNYLKQF